MATKKKKNRLQYLFGGEWMKEDFVVKQSKLMILIVALFLVFISNDYAWQKKQKEIEALRDTLKAVQYENLILKTEITKAGRQSQIEEKLKAMGSDLESPKTPAYEISK